MDSSLMHDSRTTIHRAKDFLLDIVFPKECFSCGVYGSWWCNNCQDRVVFMQEGICIGCNRISRNGETCFYCLKAGHPLDGFLAVSRYREPQIKAAIRYLKYHSVRDLSQPLGALLAHVFMHGELSDYWWHAVPVPLHTRRERMRGFNQAELLARAFETVCGIEQLPVLQRVRFTEPQVELTGKARRENVKGIFRVSDPGLVYGKNILLLDDVATTGSTLSAAARALREAGAARIWGLTVAHG